MAGFSAHKAEIAVEALANLLFAQPGNARRAATIATAERRAFTAAIAYAGAAALVLHGVEKLLELLLALLTNCLQFGARNGSSGIVSAAFICLLLEAFNVGQIHRCIAV